MTPSKVVVGLLRRSQCRNAEGSEAVPGTESRFCRRSVRSVWGSEIPTPKYLCLVGKIGKILDELFDVTRGTLLEWFWKFII